MRYAGRTCFNAEGLNEYLGNGMLLPAVNNAATGGYPEKRFGALMPNLVFQLTCGGLWSPFLSNNP